MTNHIFGYARVSSANQNEARQLDAINQHGVDQVFIDKASGKDFNRPAFEDMQNKLRRGDTVIVQSLDRLGRSTSQILSLIDDWVSNGIGLTILNDSSLSFNAGGDLSATQKLMLTVLSGVAELERSLIKERQLEGIQAAKQRGVKFGAQSKGMTLKEVNKAIKAADGNKAKAAKDLGMGKSFLM